MKVRYLRVVRRAFRALRHPKLRHRPWWQVVSKPLFQRNLWVPCRDSVASGLAIGLFFSMIFMPLQSLPAALLAMRMKGNVPLAMAACWITNPFTMGPVMYGQFWLGQWLRTTLRIPMPEFFTKMECIVPGVGSLNAASFILGMFAMGALCAAVAYPLVHLFAAILPHHLPARKPILKGVLQPAPQSDVP